MAAHHLNKLEYLDFLIRKKATGNPRVLARKLHVSVRTVYEYVLILRSLGAPISYSRDKETYVYDENGGFKFKFIQEQS